MTPVDHEADWRQLVLDGWPAITAFELLRDSQDVWLAEGLIPPKDDEAVALAATPRVRIDVAPIEPEQWLLR